jgi:hypothetical protein
MAPDLSRYHNGYGIKRITYSMAWLLLPTGWCALGLSAHLQQSVIAGALMNVILVCTVSVCISVLFSARIPETKSFCAAYSCTAVLLLLFCSGGDDYLNLETVYRAYFCEFQVPQDPFGHVDDAWSASIAARFIIPVLSLATAGAARWVASSRKVDTDEE